MNDEVTYKESIEFVNYQTGLKVWKGVEYKSSVMVGEDHVSATKRLQDKAEKYFMENVYKVSTPYADVQSHPQEIRVEKTPDDTLIEIIENYCDTLTLLERQKPQVERRNNQKLTDAYEKKRKELIQKNERV